MTREHEAGATFAGLDAERARAFADVWLPAWTGNDPDRLVGFYTEDCFYSDPQIPAGVRGRAALRAYFVTLLGQNPAWIWTHSGSTPLDNGFLNRWHASIPVGARTIECDGVCVVQIRGGLIYSNEVFFDRTELVTAIRGARSAEPKR